MASNKPSKSPNTSSQQSNAAPQPNPSSNWKQFWAATKPIIKSEKGDWMHEKIARKGMRRLFWMSVIASQVALVMGMAKDAGDDFVDDGYDWLRNFGEFWHDPAGNTAEFVNLYGAHISDPDNLLVPFVNASYNQSVDTLEEVVTRGIEFVEEVSDEVDFANDVFERYLDLDNLDFSAAESTTEGLLATLPLSERTEQDYELISSSCALPAEVPNSERDTYEQYPRNYIRDMVRQINDDLERCSATTVSLEMFRFNGESIFFNEDGYMLLPISDTQFYILIQPNRDGSYIYKPVFMDSNLDNMVVQSDLRVSPKDLDLGNTVENLREFLELRAEYQAYKETGELSERLASAVRERMINDINSSNQRVARDGFSARDEQFITPNMAEQIADSFMNFADIFNVDVMDLLATLREKALSVPITYYPGTRERGNIRYNDRIRVYGDSDHRITHVVVHEFMHAIFESTFTHNDVDNYNEGLTEMATIIATAAYDDPIYDAYAQSTLLLVASGIFEDIVTRACHESARPAPLSVTFGDIPSLQRLAANFGDINDDDIQNMIMYPQTDTYILDGYGRRNDSIDLLRSYARDTNGSWSRYKASLIDFVVSNCIEGEEEQQRVREKLERLWRDQ